MKVHNVVYLCNCRDHTKTQATFRPVEVYRDGTCVECHHAAVAKIEQVDTQVASAYSSLEEEAI